MKKIITLLLVLLTLCACAGQKEPEPATDGGEPAPEKVTIKVACSPTPHAEILAEAKPILADLGVDLEIVEFEDYVQPVEVVESGEIDANYFAHVPYLDNYNAEHGTTQTVVGKVHYEPFGIYPGKKASLEELADGDEILVPNDGTNETRALLLLQDNGVITLPEGTGADTIVTVNDITSYNVNVKIVEVEAAQIARSKDDAALVILNGNYALAAGLNVAKDAIAFEKSDSSAAKTYVNVVAVKAGNENNEAIKTLVSVLSSQTIQDFIEKKYEGAVVPFEE
ncbi:MAG: metal ABC transporter substrate-binding protein [Erysipelotrichaceae bacterium]|jgi:D-methionine transport system substrate-binding protein|nr:metal ABC transporter substrate-binding protein [Erysipelotrichaceae bacterium]MCR5095985.1 metal ABC transporter substrate-binding protein [Erysipelotrichaceae bacterium]